MRRMTAVTALSVAGVLLAAGAAAALNAQVLGGPSRTSVGTADTLLPDDPFIAPTLGGKESSASPSDDPSESVAPSESAGPTTAASPSTSRPSRPASPTTVPSTGGGSTIEPGDDKGGSGSSGSGSDDGGSDDSGSSGSGSGGSGSSGGGDDKPEDD